MVVPEHLPPETVGCLPLRVLSGQLPLLRVSLDVISNIFFPDYGVRSAVPLNIVAFRFCGQSEDSEWSSSKLSQGLLRESCPLCLEISY